MSDDLVPERCVIILGNVVDGVTIHGPFDTPDDATAWAEENSDDYEDWNVAHLFPAALAGDAPVATPWEPTHYSLRDGSLVRCIRWIDGTTYEVENENGDVMHLTANEWLHEWEPV